eukprot:s647_g12.t1
MDLLQSSLAWLWLRLGQLFICEIPVSNAQEPAFNSPSQSLWEGNDQKQHQERSLNLRSILIIYTMIVQGF